MDSNKNKFVRFKEWSLEKTSWSPEYHDHDQLYAARDSFQLVGKIRRGFDGIRTGWDKGCEMMKSLRRSKPSSPSLSLLDQASQLLSTKNKKVADPQGNLLQQWNKGVLLLCIVALALDPLFFYIPVVDLSKKCIDLDKKMEMSACILRTVIDLFYIFHIALNFRTGFIPRSSQAFGRGDLVTDPFAIARRYLSSYFLLDILAILPLPQVVLLVVIPSLDGSIAFITKESLKFVILAQYIPRILRIYPIYKQVKSTSGILTQTAWAGAAFNLFLYMLAGHAAGAFWYLISVERQDSCWHEECERIQGCDLNYLYCDVFRVSPNANGTAAADFFIASMNNSCPLTNPDDITDPTTKFNFGIFIDALQSRVVESKRFRKKLFYCFWWGLRNLSSMGQNLKTSTFVGEIVFAVGIGIFGLLLFALLIGNMQTYLQSISVRVEEMRVKRRDAELWMSHRMLPDDIKKRIRQYQQYKWQQTRGVEEEGLIRNLPKDLRRDIKRHLCLNSLMRVPMFEKLMDDQLIDAMCDRLKPVLYTEKSTVIREGDPVDEILFIIRGNSLTMTTNGGRTGFFNSDFLKEGDFCGEELLTWALDPNSSSNLPTSTRTVVSISDVEAFALVADDLKFVASQFRRLHSKQLQCIFRFHSPQWRTWGACFIQVAWRRYCRRKQEKALREAEEDNRLQQQQEEDAALLMFCNNNNQRGLEETTTGSSSSSAAASQLGTAIYVSRFASNVLRPIRSNRPTPPNNYSPRMIKATTTLLPQKPAEPNFSIINGD